MQILMVLLSYRLLISTHSYLHARAIIIGRFLNICLNYISALNLVSIPQQIMEYFEYLIHMGQVRGKYFSGKYKISIKGK